MSLWEWSVHGTALHLRLMSRQRLEASATALERLANPEWVSMSRDVVYALTRTIAMGGGNGRLRAYEKAMPAPVDFTLTLRMPTKRRAATAREFSVSETERTLAEARGDLLYQGGYWTRRLAEVTAERDAALAKTERRIAMLEKRLEKVQRRSRKVTNDVGVG